MTAISPVRMPKWGLSMQEGKIVDWWKEQGATISEGDDLVDIETSKITNVFEAPQAGILRRIVADKDETVAVGGLIAVIAEADVADSEIDAFITDFQANFTPGEGDDDAAGAMALELVEANGARIQLGRAGAGEGVPIVLLHGFSGDLNNWLFNLDALKDVAPVIALDLPGHGGSTKDVGDGSLAALAATIGAALDALEVTKAHLVGHSLGASVAARLAADRPALAASLSLICPASFPGTQINEAFLDGVVSARRARDLKPFIEMLFADPSLVTKDMLEDMIKFKRLDGVDEALAILRDRLVAPGDAQALAADLSNIASATIIASRQDRIVGVPDEGALPAGFKTIWIDDAGHMPHLEKAAEVNAALKAAIGG